MLQKRVFMSTAEEDEVELFTGKGQVPLVNLQEITEAEFVKGHYLNVVANPLYKESRQFIVDVKKTMLHDSYHTQQLVRAETDMGYMQFEVFHKNKSRGIALVTDYWADRIYYFKFGCSHPNDKSKSIGRCYTQYDCPDCGRSKKIDSGD
jgi:hypothetical protein